jgi:hypothetical protein
MCYAKSAAYTQMNAARAARCHIRACNPVDLQAIFSLTDSAKAKRYISVDILRPTEYGGAEEVPDARAARSLGDGSALPRPPDLLSGARSPTGQVRNAAGPRSRRSPGSRRVSGLRLQPAVVLHAERALPHGRAGRVAPAAARAAGTDKMHHGGRDFLARREDPRSYALRRPAGGARRRAFRDPAPSADGRACTWPAPTSIKKRLTARPPGHCRPFLETGDLAQACYERLRAAFLAGAWEGSPDSAQFTRGGFVSLLSLERPVWSVEICQAAPPRWQGARAPQQAALCDVVHWLLAPRPVSALARKEVS